MHYARTLNSAAPLLSFYNGVLNVFWSLIAFGPLAVFCYRFMDRPFLYAAAIASVLSLAVPDSWLRLLELGSRPAAYRRFGVHLINRFVQHGSLVNRLAGHRSSKVQMLRRDVMRDGLVGATYFRERFHLSMLLFFQLTALYAAAHRQTIWSLAITMTNVIYNLYPIWLQQYIRLRAKRSRC